jgi:hypothetical protein
MDGIGIWKEVAEQICSLSNSTYRYDKFSKQFQFSKCPVCGDKQKRLWLVTNRKGRQPFVHCFKGVCSVKNQDPFVFLSHINGIEPTKIKIDLGMSMQEIKDHENSYQERITSKAVILPKGSVQITPDNLKEHINGPERETLRAICFELENRLINVAPFCPDLYVVIPEQWNKENSMWRYRFLIPFRDKRGILRYFQGRTVNLNESLRYRGMTIEGDRPFFNQDILDQPEFIVVMEGPLDAIFVKNAIATGNNMPSEDSVYEMASSYGLSVDKMIFFPDNPYMDETGKDMMFRAIDMGMSVFMWSDPELRRYKDINQFVVDKDNPYHFISDESILRQTASGQDAIMKLKMNGITDDRKRKNKTKPVHKGHLSEQDRKPLGQSHL